MDDILSQIIAYAPDKIDTELKAAALVQGSRNMDQEPRMQFNNGLSVDPERDSFKKISNVLGAYRRYRRGEKNPALNFNQFFELYSTENFATGGSAGQLVSNTVDGSRPGYNGRKIKKKTLSKEKLNVLSKYSQEIFGQDYEKLTKPDNVAKVYNTAVNRNRGTGAFKYIPTSETNRAPFPKEQKNKLIKFAKANNIKLDFNTYPRFGVARSIKGKPGNSPVYQKIFDSYMNYNFEIFKKDTLPLKQRNFVMDNFELPKGVKNWDFDNFKFGVNSTKYRPLQKRIERKLDGPIKYTISIDRNSPKGWMTAAMERVYKNQTILLEDGSRVLKKDVDKLTYKPVFKKGTNNIIIGFKDNTPSGQGLTYYGLNKNTPKGAASWSQHKDYNKVDKFLKIAKGAQVDDPSKLLQKILDDKGITKLMGDKSVLTLNDILSHERYYNKISEIKPTKLLENQIVKHHIGGVGAIDVARANATKDIQLLSGTVNKKITGFERRLIKDGFLSKADNDILKNLGAKIRGTDGKIYGGGYTDPTKQFAAIEKEALKYAKGDQFNVKTVASYLERLGCGKAAGGRILFAEGVPSLTKCGKAGVAKLEKGLANGFKKSDVGLAQKILGSGKFLKDAVSLRGLFGPAALAFTALTEAGFVASDAISGGKSFREAIGDSAFNYLLGDKTKINSEEEFIKRLKNIPGSPSQGFRGVTDEDIGKMQYFKESLKDMGVGFKNYNTIKDLEKKIEDNTLNQQVPEFADQAFQLNTQLDKAQAENQDYFRTNTANRVSNYLMSDAAAEGAEALQKSNLMAKQDQLNNAYRSSLKGIESLKKEKEDIRGDLYRINNPTEYNEFAKYFMSKPKQEQSMIMGLGYNEGGIASLNVKK